MNNEEKNNNNRMEGRKEIKVISIGFFLTHTRRHGEGPTTLREASHRANQSGTTRIEDFLDKFLHRGGKKIPFFVGKAS